MVTGVYGGSLLDKLIDCTTGEVSVALIRLIAICVLTFALVVISRMTLDEWRKSRTGRQNSDSQ